MKKRRKKRRLTLYTVGELNKIIDSCFHPFFDEKKSFVILDGVVHALLEKDVPKSMGKFVVYNLPQLLKRSGRKRVVRRARARKRSRGEA